MISISSILKTRRGGEPVTWTGGTVPFFGHGVTHALNTWTVVGGYTPNPSGAAIEGRIATAVNPTDSSWVTQNFPGPFGYFDDVHYGSDGNYVAVGNGGRIYTALDSTGLWTRRISGLDTPSTSIPLISIYHDGTYWVVSNQAIWVSGQLVKMLIAIDPTGVWSKKDIPPASLFTFFRVFYGNGMWVAVGSDGKLFTTINPTGIWTERVSSFGTSLIFGVAYGNGIWVAVGNDGKLATAVNPTGPWVQRDSSFGTTSIRSVEYGNGAWTIVGENGKLATSIDPVSLWTQRVSSFGTSTIRDVHYGSDGYWVAVGDGDKIATARALV